MHVIRTDDKNRVGVKDARSPEGFELRGLDWTGLDSTVKGYYYDHTVLWVRL